MLTPISKKSTIQTRIQITVPLPLDEKWRAEIIGELAEIEGNIPDDVRIQDALVVTTTKPITAALIRSIIRRLEVIS